MAISLYDISVASYLQVLGSTSGILEVGSTFAREQGIELAEIVEKKLHPDMLPFRFQVISVAHHSLGAINGIKEGIFSPPAMPESDYGELQAMINTAIEQLQSMSPEEVNRLEGKAMKFKMGDFEIPFTAENFVMSFSLPNFYFHATTVYDMLRQMGAPLGKRDFMGDMRMGGQ